MNTNNKSSHTHTLPTINTEIPIFTKLYEFYKLLYQYLKLFPKKDRYTLGQKIDLTTLEIMELIIAAGYLPREQKLPILQKASIKLELLKVLVRLSHDLKCMDNNKYQQASLQIIEIGKMLGGWIKTFGKETV